MGQRGWSPIKMPESRTAPQRTWVHRHMASNRRHRAAATRLGQSGDFSEMRAPVSYRPCIGGRRSTARAGNVVLELLNREFLLGDDVLHQVSDGDEAEQLVAVHHR
jgi:hypothetical protein